MKMPKTVAESLSGEDLHTKIYKGHNRVKTEGGVTIHALCTSSDIFS